MNNLGKSLLGLGMMKVLCLIAILLISIVLGGTGHAKDVELIGAGATFPYPLYSKMFDVYNKEYGVKVNYQAIGSGGGIRQLISKTVDFGGSDAIMSDKDLAEASAPVLHVPTCAGAVVLTYNLTGEPQLGFTPDVIADIFRGKISKWNDPRISAINPGVKLPGMNITVVHRSDGSGTTFIISDYLSKVSAEWKEKVVGFAAKQIAKLQQDAGTKAEVIIESGDAHELLNQVAEKAKADLLIIGHLPPGGHLGENGSGYTIIRDSRIPVLSI
jgi:ABC-type phosphate transport system substrate-binding protein